MKVSVIDLSPTQKKLRVEIPASKVQPELDKRYRELGKRVRLKGFRPGKVPRKILQSYYGKSVEGEVSNQFIQETYPEALKQIEIKPLIEADVDEIMFNDDGSLTYTAVLEVCPPFKVERYKGLEVVLPQVQISQDRIDAELEKFREQHAELLNVDEDQPIEEGHVVVVDFTPSVNGEVYANGQTTDYMMEVGQNAIHADFDQHLLGHKTGDEVSFDLDYPPDAPTKEIAGKTVHFNVKINVKIKEIKKKEMPELSDEFICDLGEFESLADLTEKIRSDLEEVENQKIRADVHEQLISKLIEQVEFELPEKVIEREVDRFVAGLKQQFQSQGLNVETSVFDSPEVRAEYRPRAERSLRWRLIAERIAEQEGIELTEQERDEIYGQVARILRLDVQTVKSSYADSVLASDMMAGKLQEKILHFLEEHATHVDKIAQDETEKPQDESQNENEE